MDILNICRSYGADIFYPWEHFAGYMGQFFELIEKNPDIYTPPFQRVISDESYQN